MTLTTHAPADVSLQWGRRYLMVRPRHFRIDYQINPFMDLMRQPNAHAAMAQSRALADAIEAAGGTVETVAQRPDSPDMVYAMNLGLAVNGPDGARVVMSHMRFPERRAETRSALRWFSDHGFRPSFLGRDGVGPFFESGDAVPFGGELVVGYWPRSDELALKYLAAELDIRVRGVRIAHPAIYHLDLAFCPLDERVALVCPSAFDATSAREMVDLVPEPIVLTGDEAMTFVANSIVVGRRVIAPACPPRVRRQIENAGFEVEIVCVDEFHKGGGSIRCLTNPIDIVIGRDLALVPGGEVVGPRA
ncbi:MAG TPA: arginine deiminase-related protein [Nocardioidaceae bacterium]|nr:arginine deiminase-related protein [Nocardioidaceae bacterium]